MTNTNTAANIISKASKACAGVYTGTLTVEGQTFNWRAIVGVAGENCDHNDNGWWQLITDEDGSGWTFPTKKAAIESLHAGEWYIHPQYGLCQR
jgi:hypothetical protein